MNGLSREARERMHNLISRYEDSGKRLTWMALREILAVLTQPRPPKAEGVQCLRCGRILDKDSHKPHVCTVRKPPKPPLKMGDTVWRNGVQGKLVLWDRDYEYPFGVRFAGSDFIFWCDRDELFASKEESLTAAPPREPVDAPVPWDQTPEMYDEVAFRGRQYLVFWRHRAWVLLRDLDFMAVQPYRFDAHASELSVVKKADLREGDFVQHRTAESAYGVVDRIATKAETKPIAVCWRHGGVGWKDRADLILLARGSEK